MLLTVLRITKALVKCQYSMWQLSCNLISSLLLGCFSVLRICSRMRIWPACVAPAKNNFICESIVKRDKRTRHAGRCAERYIRMRKHTCNFSALLETDGAHAPYCTNDCLYRHATRRVTETQTAYDPQRDILRMRAKPACVSKFAWH
jgi:hypothetical protein